MALPFLLQGVAMAVQAGAAALGQWLSEGDSREERRLRMEALKEYTSMAPPEAQEVIARTVAGTSMENVVRDAGQESIRDEVQGRLLERVRGGGMDAQSRARYEEARLRSAQQSRAGRQAALARAGVRGLGPEAALTDMLFAQQAGTDSERMAGLQQAADADRMALESLQLSGDMAGQRSRERWSQDAEVARARDDMARFNVGMMADADRFNAQQRNWAWEADFQRRGAIAGASNDLANYYQRRGDTTRGMWGGIGQAAGYAINSVGDAGGFAPQGGPSSAGRGPSPVAQRSATPYEAANPGAIGSRAALPDDEIQRWRSTQQPTTRRAR